MWDDPIVAEVRDIREKLAAKFNFDVKAIFADLRKRQGSQGGKLIPQKHRAAPAAEADRGRDTASPKSTSSGTAPAA